MLIDAELDRAAVGGLTQSEAAQRLASTGYNELPSARQRSLFGMILGIIAEPTILLLVAAGGIYLLLGDLQEALLLLSSILLVVGISFYQEQKTERALEALRDLSSPRALVIRDGVQQRIAGREVAPGDVIILVEGDRVPADAAVISCLNITVDESLLTGESVPVRKVVWDGEAAIDQPGGEGLPFVFSGTLVVRGRGLARVVNTGAHTAIGKIGKALKGVEVARTPLQREIAILVRNLAVAGLGLCVVVVLLYGLTRSDWLNGFLAGIALAMAMIPEEFPVVLAIFLALGAWRISRQGVLMRRVPAIETLGAATVLCVDKTGTLTQNRMSISRITAHGLTYDMQRQTATPLPELLHETVEFGILASNRDPFDPMELAFAAFGTQQLAQTEHLHGDWTLVREYPLSEHLLAISHVWQAPDGDRFVIAAKGAPEAIADLCHMSAAARRAHDSAVAAMAGDGLRVLGVARGYFAAGELPEDQHDFIFECLGLVGLADPLRPSVRAALKECYGAGVRVIMITGDYPLTAQSIARQIGLRNTQEVITGPELDALTPAALAQRIRHTDIFARVVPEQKLRLVAALKDAGEVVAMTGDGVNDAPALKAAHIGIAMGSRGTDVAREAAAMVLLDDDFSSIVQTVRLGRRIFDNLKKAMAYILAIHVPIAGLSLLPVLLGWPLLLMPVHIVFLEMIIHPACSIAFEAEPEEADTMARPPRGAQEPLLSRLTIALSILQGASTLAVVLTVFTVAYYRGENAAYARTLTFASLIFANLGLILANRSWTQPVLRTLRAHNAALAWVLAGTVIVLGLVLYVPALRQLFSFSLLQPEDLLICILAGVASVLWFEALKALRGRGSRAGRAAPTGLIS